MDSRTQDVLCRVCSYRFSTDTHKIVDLLFKLHIKTYLQAEENYFDMVEKQQTAVMSLRTAHTPAYNNFRVFRRGASRDENAAAERGGHGINVLKNPLLE